MAVNWKGDYLSYKPDEINQPMIQETQDIPTEIKLLIDSQQVSIKEIYHNLTQKQDFKTQISADQRGEMIQNKIHSIESQIQQLQQNIKAVQEKQLQESVNNDSQHFEQIKMIEDKLKSGYIQQVLPEQIQLSDQHLIQQNHQEQSFKQIQEMIQNEDTKELIIYKRNQIYEINTSIEDLNDRVQKLEQKVSSNQPIISSENMFKRLQAIENGLENQSINPSKIESLVRQIKSYNKKLEYIYKQNSGLKKEDIENILQMYNSFIQIAGVQESLPKLIDYLQKLKKIHVESASFNDTLQQIIILHNKIVSKLTKNKEEYIENQQYIQQETEEVVQKLNSIE